jgi:hypothetical protein
MFHRAGCQRLSYVFSGNIRAVPHHWHRIRA